jgi:hypothetical protein
MFKDCEWIEWSKDNVVDDSYDTAELVLVDTELTAFMLWRQYWRHFGGSFFTGAYLPQKSVLSPPMESQYVSVQRHVSFYILNRSLVRFVSL